MVGSVTLYLHEEHSGAPASAALTEPRAPDNEVPGRFGVLGVFGSIATDELPRRRTDRGGTTRYVARRGSQYVRATWRGDVNNLRSLRVFDARFVVAVPDGTENGKRRVVRLRRGDVFGTRV